MSEIALRNVAEVVMGQSPPGSTYNESGDGLPFFQGVKDFGHRSPQPRVYCSVPTRIAQDGDILLSVRAPIGRVNLADRECAIGRGLAIIRPRCTSDARYLEVALRQVERSWVAIEGGGSVFGNATKQDLETLSLRWPVRAERRAIGCVLGHLDDRIELNRRVNETLEGIARALFKSWFVDFDPVRAKTEGRDTGLPLDIANLFPDRFAESDVGRVPEGWQCRTLGALCSAPQYGYTASARAEAVGPRFLRITDMNKAPWIAWDDVPYCTISETDFKKYKVNSGDLLIARMADPGHGILVEDGERAVFASYLIRFRPVRSAHGRFLQYWLRSRSYWDLVEGRFSGTTRKTINAKQLSTLPLVVPSLPVAQAFQSRVDPFRAEVVANCKSSTILGHLRDVLLPNVVSGEVRLPSTLIERYARSDWRTDS